MTSFDFFNYSTTDAYDTSAFDQSTTNVDTNLSDRDYDVETTKTGKIDEYDYDDEDSSRRRRKKRSNETIVDFFDYNYDEYGESRAGDTVSTAIDDMDGNATFATIVFDDYTITNESTDGYNQTEFISSTIASFIANITSTEWPDEMNTTYASELWTEYVTTLNSSFTDEYDENESDEICYVTRCEVIEEDEKTSPTTPSTTITSTKAATTTTTPTPRIEQPAPNAPTCPPLNIATAIADLLPTTMSTGNETRYGNITGLYTDQRKYCWETMFGQELVKLTVLDLVRRRI